MDQTSENTEDETMMVVIGKEGTFKLIDLDLKRSFPALAFFKEDGPLYSQLRNVLESFAFMRPDIGYVQGMS